MSSGAIGTNSSLGSETSLTAASVTANADDDSEEKLLLTRIIETDDESLLEPTAGQPKKHDSNGEIAQNQSTTHLQRDDDDENDDDSTAALLRESEAFSMPANMSPSLYRIAADGELVFVGSNAQPENQQTNPSAVETLKTEDETAMVVSEIIATCAADVPPTAVEQQKNVDTLAVSSTTTTAVNPHASTTTTTATLPVKRKRGRPRKNPDELAAAKLNKRAKPTVKRASLLPAAVNQQQQTASFVSSAALPPPSQQLLLIQQQQQLQRNRSFDTLVARYTNNHSMHLQHAFNIPHPQNCTSSSVSDDGRQSVIVVRDSDDDDDDVNTIIECGHVAANSQPSDDLIFVDSTFGSSSSSVPIKSTLSRKTIQKPTTAFKRHRASLDDSQLYVLGRKPAVTRTIPQNLHMHGNTSSCCSKSGNDNTSLLKAASSVLLNHLDRAHTGGEEEEEDEADDDVNDDDVTTSEAVLVRADADNNSGEGDGSSAIESCSSTASQPLSVKRAKFRQAVEALLKAAEQLDNPF